jgi:hypothetical protein
MLRVALSWRHLATHVPVTRGARGAAFGCIDRRRKRAYGPLTHTQSGAL